MSESARYQVLCHLFEASLQEYARTWTWHWRPRPLAEQLSKHRDSVESITAILQEQVYARSEFQGGDRIIKLLNSIILVLLYVRFLPLSTST